MASQIEENNSNYPPGAVGFATSNGATEVALIAAPGATKRLRLRGIQLSSIGDTSHTVTFRNGISGATFYSIVLGPSTAAPTYINRDVDLGPGFILSKNQSLQVALEGASALVKIGASCEVLEESGS